MSADESPHNNAAYAHSEDDYRHRVGDATQKAAGEVESQRQTDRDRVSEENAGDRQKIENPRSHPIPLSA